MHSSLYNITLLYTDDDPSQCKSRTPRPPQPILTKIADAVNAYNLPLQTPQTADNGS